MIKVDESTIYKGHAVLAETIVNFLCVFFLQAVSLMLFYLLMLLFCSLK